MLTLKWSIKALIDFDEAQAYIDKENSVVYRVTGDDVEILRVRHGRRNWMNRTD